MVGNKSGQVIKKRIVIKRDGRRMGFNFTFLLVKKVRVASVVKKKGLFRRMKGGRNSFNPHSSNSS